MRAKKISVKFLTNARNFPVQVNDLDAAKIEHKGSSMAYNEGINFRRPAPPELIQGLDDWKSCPPRVQVAY